jgi:hypothetical protein
MINLVPTDKDSLVFARTITQVLNIVYLGGTESGGFFPDGINGVFGENSREEVEAALAALDKQLASTPASASCPVCDGDMTGSYDYGEERDMASK